MATDLHELLDRILDAAVEMIVGQPVGPRPGQRQLAHDILLTMCDQTRLAGVAPTGVGKSLAAIAPAFLVAVEREERTVLSTESLSLQSQILYKDAPLFAEAVERVTGKRPTFAVHKGFSNYVCSMQVDLLKGEIDKGEVNLSENLEELLGWAAQTDTGDRADYDGEMDPTDWSQVSLAPDDCIGMKACGRTCLPRKARDQLSDADLIVTNHHLLAMQANIGAPVVFGNLNIGDLHHLVVDEAHALPGVVRSAGSREISEPRVHRVATLFGKCVDDRSGFKSTIDHGHTLARQVTSVLAGMDGKFEHNPLHGPGGSEAGNTDGGLGGDLRDWAETSKRMLPSPESYPGRTQLNLKRAKGALQRLSDDAEAAIDDSSAARWVDGGRELPSFKVSPVDVSSRIENSLFLDRSVTCISATLPPGFARESGQKTPSKDYPSPFDSAYGASMLYVPRVVTETQLQAIAAPGHRGKWKFDVYKHPAWASGLIKILVEANRGHALVLSSTTAAGKKYAAELRVKLPHLKVYSQWDGRDVRSVVAQWRADPSSVLVGTRSLMTGTDAPGETCSLVILDRIPRDAGNVVDDARVEQVCRVLGVNKWEGDRYVYGSDASLRLEQAGGRLIRQVTDAGMLAVLDPRMVPNTPLSYNRQTLDLYLHSLRRFTIRRSKITTAQQFLTERATAREQTADTI